MSIFASLVLAHLAGEGKDEISLDTLPGKFTVRRTLKPTIPSSQDLFCDTPEDEVAVAVGTGTTARGVSLQQMSEQPETTLAGPPPLGAWPWPLTEALSKTPPFGRCFTRQFDAR